MADKKTVLLRLNPKIWDEINKWAQDEFRSINGQIEYLLNESVKKRKKEINKD
ncbi:MAG: Arc family DNA binding domain-containing protein [Clostridiales bacterium]